MSKFYLLYIHVTAIKHFEIYLSFSSYFLILLSNSLVAIIVRKETRDAASLDVSKKRTREERASNWGKETQVCPHAYFNLHAHILIDGFALSNQLSKFRLKSGLKVTLSDRLKVSALKILKRGLRKKLFSRNTQKEEED